MMKFWNQVAETEVFISAIADRLHKMGASDQSIKHNVTGVETG